MKSLNKDTNGNFEIVAGICTIIALLFLLCVVYSMSESIDKQIEETPGLINQAQFDIELQITNNMTNNEKMHIITDVCAIYFPTHLGSTYHQSECSKELMNRVVYEDHSTQSDVS